MTDGLGRTDRMDYDQMGRLTSQSDLSAAGATLRTTTYAYDPDGNLASSTDPYGRVTSYTFDALDRLVRQVEPVSATKTITTTFGYDGMGNRTRYTDGRGNATIYTYNSLNMPESVVVPATPAHTVAADRTWLVSYNAANQATKLTAPGNVVRQRTYDGAGRLALETGSGAGVATTERRFTYDLSGRLLTSNAMGGTDTYTYNDRGQMLTATGPSGNATFEYDADGNLLTRADRAGTSRFTYNKSRLATMTDGVTGVTQGLGYDGAGRVRTVDYGSGRIRAYGFDALGRLDSDVLKNTGGATVSSVGYTFDNEDRMVRKVTTGTAGAADNTYGYDFAGRLTSWTVGTNTVVYEWDDSGNRTRNGVETASYDARDRLLADTGHTYTYTARGTLATRVTSGQTEQYSFDAFDRMVSARGQTYAYDGQNRLAGRGSATFSYAGTDDDPVSDGTQIYARGPEGELLGLSQGTQRRLVLSDEHDDLVGAFDPANTALSALDESRAYSPFGEPIAEDSGVDAELGFQGDYTDPATGAVNMGARWYSPESGTFLSRDAATYSSGPSILANPYVYGAGDPLDYTDPDGNWPKISCGICKKVKKAVTKTAKSIGRKIKKGIKRAFKSFRSFASRSWSMIRSGISRAWSAVKWAAGKIASGARWLYHKARSAVKWVAGKVSSAVRWVADRVSSGFRAIRGAVSRGVSWARDRAEEVRRAAIAAAHRVTNAARGAVRWAVEHNPLPAIAAALKPVYSAMRKVVSAAAHLPAAVVSTVRDVVRDATRAVQVVYQKAVEAAGTVVEAVSTAASAVSEFAQAALPMVAGIAAGVLTTAGCLAVTGGAGSAGCVIAGFAAGSAVTSALSCPPGRSIVGCAARGGAAGAVGGAVFVATGGMGSGMTAAIVSGAASNGASSAAAQYLDTGEIDGGLVAFDAAVGGVTGAFGARGRGRRSPSGQSSAGHPPPGGGGGGHPGAGRAPVRPEIEITTDGVVLDPDYWPHSDPNLTAWKPEPSELYPAGYWPPADFVSPYAPNPMGPEGGSKGRRGAAGILKAIGDSLKWL